MKAGQLLASFELLEASQPLNTFGLLCIVISCAVRTAFEKSSVVGKFECNLHNFKIFY